MAREASVIGMATEPTDDVSVVVHPTDGEPYEVQGTEEHLSDAWITARRATHATYHGGRFEDCSSLGCRIARDDPSLPDPNGPWHP